MDWLALYWIEGLSLLLLAIGVWWLMPRAARWPKTVGLLLAVAGAALLASRIEGPPAPWLESVLFWLFAGAAVVSAILMITNRNPVYSALWFALVTLSVCGLFLLQFAPFLAAATIVVYAGAIVVTFVFVIMLAQQSGATAYDQRSRQPVVATFAAFVLFAIIINALLLLRTSDAEPVAAREAAAVANPLSQVAADAPLGRMHGLGRSLFGDYLYAVELAGTLLLVATIGAIAIVPRRRRGTL
jgi:NADH-quinone oxidoreductase subunit J